MLAVDFGELHCSCPEAMVWRESLPPTATQADAYLACYRGDWLLWQLSHLPREQYESLRPAIQRALDRIVERAIHRGLAEIEGVDEPWAEKWRKWAEAWLSGEDRLGRAARASAAVEWKAAAWVAGSAVTLADASWSAVAAAAEAEEWSAVAWWGARAASRRAAEAAEAEELRLQAEEIRAEIPKWPSE